MDTPSKPVGYECEFVDQVPEDYFCKQCKHVAREPTIASCCTEVLCKACIEAVIENNKPCPSCGDTDISHIPHKKHRPKILALKVCCSLKDRGCEWTGQLQHLDAHLDLTTGDCVYVDVDCPSKCNHKVQKRNVDTHLADHCPNRDYTCPHCSFKANFREVSQHFEVCRYYPLVCPNRCGASFERDDLEDHMRMCGLQKVQCEFSYAGCEAEFIRDQQKEHMEQNTQKHLALVAAATLRISQTFEQKLQEKDAQIKSLEEQQKVFEKKLGEQREEFHKQLEEKDQQINKLKEKHALAISNLCSVAGLPPCEVSFLSLDSYIWLSSSPMYTHPGGFRFNLRVYPKGGEGGAYVAVHVCLVRGDYDETGIFAPDPARFTITLELLNQHRDQDHHRRDIWCAVTRDLAGTTESIGCDNKFISRADLKWNADEHTEYLKEDCLKFRVSKVEFAN